MLVRAVILKKTNTVNVDVEKKNVKIPGEDIN